MRRSQVPKERGNVYRQKETIWFDSELDLEIRMSPLGAFELYSRDYKRRQWIGYIDALKRLKRLVNIAIKEHKQHKEL